MSRQSNLLITQADATTVRLPSAIVLRAIAFWLSLCLIFVIPMEGALFVDGVGRLSRIVGILAGGVWLFAMIAAGTIRKPGAFHYAMGLFILWNALSVFWTINTDRTIERTKTYAQLGFMVMMFWDLYGSSRKIYLGLQAFVFGAFCVAIATIANYINSNAFYAGRFAAAGLHVDDLGVMVVLGIPIAWYLFLDQDATGVKRIELRCLNVLFVPIAVIAILLSGTRTAAVCAIPAFAYILVSLNRIHAAFRFWLSGVILLSVCVVGYVVPQASIDRMGTVSHEFTTGDLNGRVALWRQGWAAFSQRPLTGIGSYGFRTLIGNKPPFVAHNSAMSVLVELGLIGFSCFAFLGLLVLRAARNHPRGSRGLWLSMLAVLFLGVSALTWEHRKPFWLMTSLLTCSACLVKKSRAQESLSAVSPDGSGLSVGKVS